MGILKRNNMNIVQLNTTAPDNVIVRGNGGGNSGGGSSSGGMKYYECLFDEANGEEGHSDWNLANVKYVDSNNGEVYIAPDGWNGVEWEDDAAFIKVAVAVPQGRKYYANGQWLDEKEMYLNTSYFDLDTHIEITEEEFYHIPEDAVFDVSKEEDRKALMDFLYPKSKRYYEAYGKTAFEAVPFFFKSLTLVDPVANYRSLPKTVQMGDLEGVINPDGKELLRIGAGLEYFLYHDPETDSYYGEFMDFS